MSTSTSTLIDINFPVFDTTSNGEELFTCDSHRNLVQAVFSHLWKLIYFYNQSNLQKYALMFNVPCNNHNNTIASYTNMKNIPQNKTLGDVCPHNTDELIISDLLNMPNDSIISVKHDNEWVHGPTQIRSYMGKRIGNVVMCFISPTVLHNEQKMFKEIFVTTFQSFETVIFNRSYSIRAEHLNGVRPITHYDDDEYDDDNEDERIVTCSFKRAKPV